MVRALVRCVDRWDVISRDRRSAKVSLRVDDNDSRTILELADWAEDWWREHGSPDFTGRAAE